MGAPRVGVFGIRVMLDGLTLKSRHADIGDLAGEATPSVTQSLVDYGRVVGRLGDHSDVLERS
jgi:hypothetical protein